MSIDIAHLRKLFPNELLRALPELLDEVERLRGLLESPLYAEFNKLIAEKNERIAQLEAALREIAEGDYTGARHIARVGLANKDQGK